MLTIGAWHGGTVCHEGLQHNGPAWSSDPAATTTPSSLKQTDFFMATTLCHP
jgi:hypothetical protein